MSAKAGVDSQSPEPARVSTVRSMLKREPPWHPHRERTRSDGHPPTELDSALQQVLRGPPGSDHFAWPIRPSPTRPQCDRHNLHAWTAPLATVPPTCNVRLSAGLVQRSAWARNPTRGWLDRPGRQVPWQGPSTRFLACRIVAEPRGQGRHGDLCAAPRTGDHGVRAVDHVQGLLARHAAERRRQAR